MIIGLDMGGTHIDGVIIKEGQVIHSVKTPNDPDHLFESIWTTLTSLLADYDPSQIQKINLSTTVSTNAIVENKISPVGMIIQSGPGLYNDFLACGDENVFISGSIDHQGRIVQELDPNELKNAIHLFQQKNIKACAVITKFSTRNPNHELQIKKQLIEHFPIITLGHTLSGKLNFPRRVFTSYLNSAVTQTFQNFSKSIQQSLMKEGISAPVSILKADGGTMSLNAAEKCPVETILSGPAASFMGMNAMLAKEEDAILLDIGGTTTDLFFLADGIPLFEPLGIKIGPYKTLVRAIYSVSIGLGGDSAIHIQNNQMIIGPKREGRPYAFGGPTPTPTDAMIVLGLIQEGDKKRAYKAMEKIGQSLDLTTEKVATSVLETMGNIIQHEVKERLKEINAQPVYTVKELLYGKKIKPTFIHIIGGPAKVLAPILEKKFQLPCYYPKEYQVANAIGAAMAKTTTEITMIADTSQGIMSVPEMGIYEKIGSNFNLEIARQRALTLLKENAQSIGADNEKLETEITEESSFNMVRGFYTSGQNIRVKAQIKPGLAFSLRGVTNYESKK
ncbi:MAG: hydantoinase/oxoprolinase family protein [Epulopiscium sp.]|nr:hydantoinase/oxoprolinase family protein [Candidatus Epulonipiscium sp.]